jgi:acetyl-CoA synthetase
MAQKDIQSVLQEDRVFSPTVKFRKHAAIKAGELQGMYAKAAHDYVGFWADLAVAEIDWHRPFTQPLDDSQAPNYRWFTDGQLNVSHNCLDVHLRERGQKTAILFEGEPGDVRKLTYAELHAEVCRFANALKGLRVGRGDRVVIYMPLIPEAVIAMQACARIGAVHSVVFGGFSANAVKDRIEDAGASLVITADGGWRGGQRIELKLALDKALDDGCPTVKNVIVYRRTGGDCNMWTGRDLWWHDAVAGQSATCEPEWVDAEHPLFLLYTSGSTGKPKGIQHCSAGYLLNAKTSIRWVFDLKDHDIFWCTADVGWVTGHTYVVYGPLAAGATVLMYEGAPTFPDGGRFWKICEPSQHSLYGADCDPRPHEAGRRHSGQVRPAQAAIAGERRRAHQPGSVDVVPQGHRRRALPHRGYLVADGDRGRHDDARPGCHAGQARFLRQTIAGNFCRHRR